MYLTTENAKSMMNFIAEKARTRTSPIYMTDLFKEYVIGKSDMNYASQARIFRTKIAPNLHRAPFDMETRVRMMFLTSAHVHNEFLSELREWAEHLELSGSNVIKGCRKGDLELFSGKRKAAKGAKKTSESEAPKKKKIRIPEFNDSFDRLMENTPEDPPTRTIQVKLEPRGSEEDVEIIGELRAKSQLDAPKSAIAFLRVLRSTVVFLDSTELVQLRASIELALDDPEFSFKKIPMSIIVLAIKNIFANAHSNIEDNMEKTSRKYFLRLLRTMTIDINAVELLEIQNTIEEAIERIGDSDEQISISNIHVALQSSFVMVYNGYFY